MAKTRRLDKETAIDETDAAGTDARRKGVPLRNTREASTPDLDGEPGTTDQRPRWEGPPENRPRGYLPAKDNPEIDRDAAGENLADPDRSDLGDVAKKRDD